MKSRPDVEVTRPETVLLVPFAIILIGLLFYFLLELVPTVRVLPG